MLTRTFPTLLVLSLLSAGTAHAADEPPPAATAESRSTTALPTVELQALLQRVGETTHKRFLVDSHVPSEVVVGTVDPRTVTYPILLAILRNNNMAAFTQQGIVNVVPADEIRHFAVPVVEHDDSAIPDDEWVTRVARTHNVSAAQLVPILRPLVPRGGHLAALPDQNALLLVDSYANGRRVLELIGALDKPSTKSP